MPVRRSLGSVSATLLLSALLLAPGTTAAANTQASGSATTTSQSSALPVLPPEHCVILPIVCFPLPQPPA